MFVSSGKGDERKESLNAPSNWGLREEPPVIIFFQKRQMMGKGDSSLGQTLIKETNKGFLLNLGL